MVAMMDYEQTSLLYIQEYNRTGNKEELLKLYNLHRRLFYKISLRFSFLLDQEDILQECYIALVKAVEGFQEEKGDFTKYLAKTTNQYLFRIIQENNSILPEYMTRLINQYYSLLEELEAQGLEKPKDSYIAYRLNIPEETLKSLYLALSARNTTSLDIPLDTEEEGETLEDITPSPYNLEEACINDLFTEEIKERVNECISLLSEADQELIKKRYIEEMALSEIDPDKSTSRNKQRVDKAFRRLQRIGQIKLASMHREIIYNKALQSNGAEQYNRTWTSSTERIVLQMEEDFKRL